MRNDSKCLRRAALIAVAAWVALPIGAAENKETAGAAQDFLAKIVSEVVAKAYFVDAQGRINHVSGKYSGEVKTAKVSTVSRNTEDIRQLPERVVDRQVWDVRAVTLDAIDTQGRPNECATRITAVTAPDYDETRSDVQQENATFSYKLITTNEQWRYEPLTKFTNPAQVIDWRNVSVSRSPDGNVAVTSYGQTYAKIEVAFVPGDLDLADRIEYAMRFLAMSCNASTGTAN